MLAVLSKASILFLIILMGYFLKRVGFFGPDTFKILSKILLNITLPCTIISNFGRTTMDFSMLAIAGIGFLCNVLMILVGYAVTPKKKEDIAFAMLNYSGYNIGSFTMPYIQGFLGPAGVVTACLFDAGNAVLCIGGTYAIVSVFLNPQEKTTVSSFCKKIFSIATVDVYLIMMFLTLINIFPPEYIMSFADTVGAANSFIAMLMIGVGINFQLKKNQISVLVKMLIYRYGIAAILAALFYFYLPFPLEIRQVTALIALAPISSSAAAFTEKCDGDVGLASTMSSLSILISVILMTSMLLTMHIT